MNRTTGEVEAAAVSAEGSIETTGNGEAAAGSGNGSTGPALSTGAGRSSASALAESQRMESRAWILQYARRGSVGAELGVFCGDFSRVILREVRPARLYLVDAWSLMWGECFPDWGLYSDYGQLTTAEAKALATAVTSEFPEIEIEIMETIIEDFLREIDPSSLDFVYIDAGHGYEETLNQLFLSATRVKGNGVILGDDWRPNPKSLHHGVFRAVQDFTRLEKFEIVAAGPGAQFCLRRRRPRPIQ